MYPKIRSLINEDNVLADYFTLTDNEKKYIKKIKSAINRIGFAVQLKTYTLLGYQIDHKTDIPYEVVDYISKQLEMSPRLFYRYKWQNRNWYNHLSIIREMTGFRAFEIADKKDLYSWCLKQERLNPTRNEIMGLLTKRLRELKIELPSEKEFWRTVNSSRQLCFDVFFGEVDIRLDKEVKEKMDECLNTEIREKSFGWLKKPPGKIGMNTILDEINKLNYIRSFKIDKRLFERYNGKMIDRLYNRVRGEDGYLMKRHTPKIRYTFLAIYLYYREMEITDNILETFLGLIRKIEKQSDKVIEKELIGNIKKVYGKKNILRKLTFAVTGNPDGSIKDTIFPEVEPEIFKRLAEEFESEETGDSYEIHKAKRMRQKYARFYRRMMKPILDTIDFNTNNSKYDSLLKGLSLVHKYIDSKHIYYPEHEEIPWDVLTDRWAELAVEADSKRVKVRKHYFELSVLSEIEKTLKCKEIWTPRGMKFRNPDEDLPFEWKENRIEYYERLKTPLSSEDFKNPIKTGMYSNLISTNSYFNQTREDDVYIYQPGGGKRGYWRVPKIKNQGERPILDKIRKDVIKRWGILDLLDVLVEADRMVNFSRFFKSAGQRQVLSEEEIRERLLLIIFSLGTNVGLKRIYSAAKPNCEYKDLLYFRKRFLNPDALREAIAALTNMILEIRHPLIWGNTTACASDGKQFGTWDQNLLASSNPHYQSTGIMVYWHVDRNAACIYSQIKNCNSSERAAMIQGLLRHETMMKLESNYVDTHGQSEIAFAICHFLGIDLLPRLKSIKKQKLYLPDKGILHMFPNLKSVIARPIRWDLISEQYDEMVKHVAAIVENPSATESILRRFSSHNRTHPTYKAMIELGKAKKTMFLCRYLTSKELRQAIHAGLNVVENWNSANTFICFGNKSELQTNDPLLQEMTILCLHLLQNAVILINTIMIDKVVLYDGYLSQMQQEDLNALSPLYTSNINPYGGYNLNLNQPSILEAA